MTQIHPMDAKVITTRLRRVARALDHLTDITTSGGWRELTMAVYVVLGRARDVVGVRSNIWAILDEIDRTLLQLAGSGGPITLAAAVMGSEAKRLAERLNNSVQFRKLQQYQTEQSFDISDAYLNWSQLVGKEVVLELRRGLPVVSGVLCDVLERKSDHAVSYLLLVVDNNRLGGRRKRVHINWITRVTIPPPEKAQLESLLRTYVGDT